MNDDIESDANPESTDPPEVHDQLWAGFAGTTGWDVGANIGQSLPEMTARFTTVHAFEPAEPAYAALVDNYGASGVMLHYLAVADHDGELTTSLRQGPGLSGQLVAAGMPYYGEDYGPETAVWGNQLAAPVVPCLTADTLADRFGVPDFVKVDTEGHEVSVLLGAARLLETRLVAWLVEFHTEDRGAYCVEILAKARCRVEIVRHPRYEVGSGMWRQHGWIRAEP